MPVRALPAGAVVALAVLALTGCGADRPTTAPPTAAPPSTGASTPSLPPPPSATPTPVDQPLSAFEADPAVQALRAFYVAAAQALNADDFSLPSLRTVSTAARAERNAADFAVDRGGYVPGPTPFTPVGVQVASATRRVVAFCGLEAGWVLTAPGGRPTQAEVVSAGEVALVLDQGVWKVDRISKTSTPCAGVPIQRRTAP